ncbi:MAG: hypothetical protein ABI813_11310, partial [Bacteroidota bacterium]
ISMKANPSPLLKNRAYRTALPMESKSAEQLLEDLSGILNNRRELLEKIIKKFPRAHDGHKMFSQYHKQTKNFQSVLLAELSTFGDGLVAPDPANAYNDCWITALQKWHTINKPRLIPFWRELETILRDIYRKTLNFTAVLPASFQTILTEQLAELMLSR